MPLVALVVEDDTLQRELLVDCLREKAIDVIECESSEAAELVLAGAGPELSLLVTDHMLGGGGTGLELACFAKARFPHMTVVLVSGRADVYSPDGVHFFRKPFDPRAVLALATGSAHRTRH